MTDKGMVYLAAEALECSHVTIYNYAKRYTSVQEAIDRNRGHVVDTAELALYDAILRKEHWAIAFTLKTIGKNRGYTERQEVTTPRDEPLEVELSATDELISRLDSITARATEAERIIGDNEPES